MVAVISVLAGLWKSFNVEVMIVLVTLCFAFAFRGMRSPGVASSKSSKSAKSGKGMRKRSEDGPSPTGSPTPPQKPRRLQVAPRCFELGGSGQAPYQTQGHGQGQAEHLPKRRLPALIVDEVVDGMRDQPGVKFASRALELYAELRQQEDLRLLEAVRGARHSLLDFYSTLVQCVVRLGQFHMITGIIEDMVKQGINRTLPFYESTMKQLAGQKHYHLALAVYDRLEADGLEPSAVTCSCLISFASEIGELERAVGFFNKLRSLTTPSIRAYMTVLRVHGRRQDWPSSLATFRDMQRRGVPVDSLALNVVLATGVSADQVSEVEALLADADNCEPPISDVVSYNTLAKCYAQHNDLQGAKSVILRIRQRGLQPNAITFNSVMDAAVRSRHASQAWDVLDSMRHAGLRPDKYTCSILVKGLAHDPSINMVQDALDLLVEVDGVLDKTLKTTLFHSLLEAAVKVADETLLANVFSQARASAPIKMPHRFNAAKHQQ